MYLVRLEICKHHGVVVGVVSNCVSDLVTAVHPMLSSAWQMAFEAIKTLKERSGSSVQAIKKHITTTHPTIVFAPHQLRSALKKGSEAGKFVKVNTAD